jgi:ADP-heptose:LPS heptosyltransferase
MSLKRIELVGKKLLYSLLKVFLREETLKKESVDLGRIKKILVVRQDDRIGNLILTTPLLSALKRFFPQAQVWYLASQTFHTLFSRSNLVDEILVAKKKQYIFHPLSLLLFIRKIRKQRFDLVIDASDENNFSLNNSFLVYLSGARIRIGYKKPQTGLFLNLEVPAPSQRKHASEIFLDLLRYVAGEFPSDGLRMEVDPDERVRVENYLKERGVENGDLLIGIHVGGRLRKRWPVESFQKLADWITESFDAKVIFFWGPEERKAIEKIETKDRNQILADLFDLPALTALIKRCNLFVSPDTGAMHLSVAVGTPTLALFLDSDPIKFGPQGSIHRTLLGSAGALPVEQVKQAFEEMLKTQQLAKT